MTDIRIGHGFDVHAFAENRKLIIGGVDIPYDLGLAGHSDADVLLHAICDALLGAAGLGDIGRHFPDTDAQYAEIDSRMLLRAGGGSLDRGGLTCIRRRTTAWRSAASWSISCAPTASRCWSLRRAACRSPRTS